MLEPFSLAQHDSKSSNETGEEDLMPVILGNARTLAAFQETVGVFYSRKHISPVALRGCSRGQHVEFACEHDQQELQAEMAALY